MSRVADGRGMPAGPLAWLATLLSVLAGAGTGTLLFTADAPSPSEPGPVTPTPETPTSPGNVTFVEPAWCPVPSEPEPRPPYRREFRGHVGPVDGFTASFPLDDAWLADRLVVRAHTPAGPLAAYRLTVDDAWGRTVARVDGAGLLQATVEDFPSSGTWRATVQPLAPAAPAEVRLDVTVTFLATPAPAPAEWRFYGPATVLGGWGTELSFERGGAARSVEVFHGGEVRLVDSWGNEVARARGAHVRLEVPADAGPRPFLSVSTDPAAPGGFEVRVRTEQERLSPDAW